MTKVELFQKDLQSTAGIFKALGHPARLAILKYLAETRTCISGDISNELPLSRTTVNQHLQELKDTGLIKGEINGVRVKYCLNNQRIESVKNMIDQFLESIRIDSQIQNC